MMKKQRNALLVLFLSLIAVPVPLYALPEGEVIKSGAANIVRNGSKMRVIQNSTKLSVDYTSFDIDSSERVEFIQPSSNSVALNRVVGANSSEIYGQLKSNGQIFLINPNGMLFGETAQLDVGGLIATTLNISDSNFLQGNFQFDGESSAAIVNEGSMAAAEGGYLALIANNVTNSGEMLVPSGSVELHSADSVLVTLSDSSISIESNKATVQGYIDNQGIISASGGQVVLNANTLNSLHSTVVNNSGLIKATSLNEVNGEIVISAHNGDVFNDGVLDVSTDISGSDADAGQVIVKANRIAQRGYISADGFGAGDGGKINLHASSELFATHHSKASADGGERGSAGEVIYFSDESALFDNDAVITARGGELSGDGGFVEVSGLRWVAAEGVVDTRAPSGKDGTFLIDPTEISIVAGNTDSNGSFGAGTWTSTADTSEIGTDNITFQLLSNNVVIDSTTGFGGSGDINVNAAIDLDGGDGRTLTLQAFNDLNINANICEGGGLCSFVDDSVAIVMSSGGALTIADGVIVDAGNSTINISSTLDTTITGLISRSASDTAIDISSASAVIDGGDSVADFNAVNGGLRILATTGIGNVAEDIDGIASKIDLNLTASGGVYVTTSSGDVELINLTSPALVDTFIDVNGGGSLTVSGFTISDALELHADGDITINDGVVVDARGETIMFFSGGDANISGLQTTNSTSSAVIVSVAGSINSSGDTNLDIDAGAGRATLLSGTGINNLEVDVESVSLSNVTSGDVSIEDINNITLVGLNTPSGSSQIESGGNLIVDNGATITANNLELTAGSGILTLPDSGLSVTGNLVLSAQDIEDNSGRDLELSAQDLTYTSTASMGDNTLNTNVDRLDVSQSSGNITVYESNGLALIDLDSDGNAVTIADGNVDITLAEGDLTVSDIVSASDLNADGVRAGLIDLKVNGGSINVGASGVTNIQSVNSVDEGATGGLGAQPSNQVAIRLLQLSAQDQSQDFSFGDGVGSDVSISAQGGDILIDALGGATLSVGNSRSVNLNRDVSITSNDSIGGNSGDIILDDVVASGATFSSADNRAILLRGSTPVESSVEPPVNLPVEEPVETPLILADIIANEVQDIAVSDLALKESVPENRRLNTAFDRIYSGCKGKSEDFHSKSSDCSVQKVMRQFLNSFIVGGELPLMGDD